MPIQIFGYGSLLNQESRHRTFVELEIVEDVVLKGYQRILNAAHSSYEYVAMNLIEHPDKSVKGHVFLVSDKEFLALEEREIGYDLVDISSRISVQLPEPVFAFVMHKPDIKGKLLCQRYLETCLGGISEPEREHWLAETVIPPEVQNR